MMRYVPADWCNPPAFLESAESFTLCPIFAYWRQVKGDVPKAKATEKSPVQTGKKNQI
jgi:hypothetical protein